MNRESRRSVMKTKHLKTILRILLILQSAPSLRADFASYASNPFVFSHAGGSGDPVDSWKGGNIQLADLTLDGNPKSLFLQVQL